MHREKAPFVAPSVPSGLSFICGPARVYLQPICGGPVRVYLQPICGSVRVFLCLRPYLSVFDRRG